MMAAGRYHAAIIVGQTVLTWGDGELCVILASHFVVVTAEMQGASVNLVMETVRSACIPGEHKKLNEEIMLPWG